MLRALIGIIMATAMAAPLAAQSVEDVPDERESMRPPSEGVVDRPSPHSRRVEIDRPVREERAIEDEQQQPPERTQRREERRPREARQSEARQSEPQAETRHGGDTRRARERAPTHNRLHREYRREHEALHRSNPTRREHRRFHREVNRDHDRYHGQWDHNWRRDRRFDWQAYRYYNRGLFDVAPYYSPYRGHSYRRFSIGVRLGSSFYSHPYWISDPWRYRLPPAYAGTRWVRYYDDVLLIDLFTGEVVDAIYNFFW